MTKYTNDLRAAKEYENLIFGALRAKSDAQMALAVAEASYKKHIADSIGAKMHNIELTTTGPCKSLIMHCVYDLRDSRWPLCVFCGSPKYGD